MVPGERTVGQTRLTVQFGGRRPRELNGAPNQAGPFIGTHDVIMAWGNDAFYVTVPATSLRMFETTLRVPGAQNACTEGRRDGGQVRPDFVTKAKCNKVSRSAREFQSIP